MRRSLMSGLALGALLCARVAAAQGQAIAVLPFANGGSYGQDKEVFEALEVGIQATLISELGRHPGVQVIERAAVRRAAGATAGQIDAAAAARIGKAAGARYVVFGNFIDHYGRFRLNARVVDAGTGEILRVASNDAAELQDRRELSRIIHSVAAGVAAGAGLAPAAGSSSTAVPTEALTFYSRGLLHEDRGDRARAREYYQKAVEALPEYAEAREGLRRIGSS